ncbi:asparagine synthase-related protein [Salinisphaera sp. T31B1]|uniref:asparagine synthase-related protein n=1 Tax=Salinisphaera sp. T31B1 TaxID=727963 RepID=UPI003341AE2B
MGTPAHAPRSLFLASGTLDVAGVRQLDGMFAAAEFFGESLLLLTDMLGAASLYYFDSPDGTFFFATDYGFLLDIIPQDLAVDDRGLAAQLAGSVCIQGQALHVGVRRLGAGEVLRKSLNTTSNVGRYFSVEDELLARGPWPRSRSYEDAIQEFDRLLGDAISSVGLLSTRGLLLSGGLDSRAILFAALDAGETFGCSYTFGDRRARDVLGARHLAAVYGLNHQVIPYDASWTIRRYCEPINSLARGASGLQPAHVLPAFARVRLDGLDGSVTGFLGDALTGAHMPRNPDTDSLGNCFSFLNRLKTANFHDLFSDAHRSNCAAVLDTEERLRKLGLTRIQQRMYIDLTVRQATWIANSFRLCGWDSTLLSPFFNKDLMLFMMSLPDDYLTGQRLYRDWFLWKEKKIKSGARRLASIRRNIMEHRIISKIGRASGLYSRRGSLSWESHVEQEIDFFRNLADAPSTSPRSQSLFSAELEAGNRSVAMVLHAGISRSLA